MSAVPDWDDDTSGASDWKDSDWYEDSRKSGYPKSFEKWGIDVVKAGYTLIPNSLININMYLSEKSKLTPSELTVLIIIISNWWNPNRLPAASKKYIGERCNLGERQIQRIIRNLERKRALRIINYGTENFSVGGANKSYLTNILVLLKKITVALTTPREQDKKLPIQLELDFSWQYYKRSREMGDDEDDVPF